MADPLSHRLSGQVQKISSREEVVRIIRETAAGIEERYEIETMGMDKNDIHPSLRSASKTLSGPHRPDLQEHYRT